MKKEKEEIEETLESGPMYQPFKKHVKTPLTKTEKEGLSLKIDKALDDIEDAESDLKLAEARFKEEKAAITRRIDELKSDLAAIRDQKKTGFQMKLTDVQEIPNKEKGVIELHNLSLSPKHVSRIISTREMDLLAISETTEEAVDEAKAIADATTDQIKEKKGKKAAKPKSEPKPKPAKTAKPGNGKGNGIVTDIDSAADLPPLVAFPKDEFAEKVMNH